MRVSNALILLLMVVLALFAVTGCGGTSWPDTAEESVSSTGAEENNLDTPR